MALPRRSSPSSLAVHHPANIVPPTNPRRYAVSPREPQNRSAEILLMVGINLVVATIAGLTILRLRPYNTEQQVKLKALEAEVTTLERRVDHLRQDFTNYFDPQQTRSNMRALSDRLENGQRKIIFVEPPPTQSPVLPLETNETVPGSSPEAH